MQTQLWYDHYQGAVYPLDLYAEATHGQHKQKVVKSLVRLCAQFIVRDSTMTQQTLMHIPQELFIPLMQEALLDNRDRSMEALIALWPLETLYLHKLVPDLFTSLLPLYDGMYLSDIVRQSLRYTTCLSHTFLECLKKRTPTKLRFLDMSGYPTAEVILYYLATHCMLAHNEARQSVMVDMYNRAVQLLPDSSSPVSNLMEADSSLPDSSFFIRLNAFVTSDQTNSELCKALKVSAFPEAKLHLCLDKLDATCLGEPKINILLRQVDPVYLTGMRLKYNSLNCEDFKNLAPILERFTNLTALDLSCNSISLYQSEATCEIMAEVLSKLPNLIRLDLSNNRIKTRLRRIISSTKLPLQYLRLVACGLTVSDITYLSMSHHVTGLREMDISENNLSSACRNLGEFMMAARNNLAVLEMEECYLGDEQLSNLQTCLGCVESLLYLNIAENTVSLPVLASVTQTFSKLPNSSVLRLAYPKECYLPDNTSEDERFKTEAVHYLQNVAEKDRNSQQPKIKLIPVELERIIE